MHGNLGHKRRKAMNKREKIRGEGEHVNMWQG